MVDKNLWQQYPGHEKLEHLSDNAKNALIKSVLEEREYRNGEGAHVVSSDIMGRPSDMERFRKLYNLGSDKQDDILVAMSKKNKEVVLSCRYDDTPLAVQMESAKHARMHEMFSQSVREEAKKGISPYY